jgi:hypothetical protein
LYLPARRSSATISRIKSEGLSVSVVIVTSKVTGEGTDYNFRAECRHAKLLSTRFMLREAKHRTYET